MSSEPKKTPSPGFDLSVRCVIFYPVSRFRAKPNPEAKAPAPFLQGREGGRDALGERAGRRRMERLAPDARWGKGVFVGAEAAPTG
ncbi:hypothetical protein [Desulfosoma sp.]